MKTVHNVTGIPKHIYQLYSIKKCQKCDKNEHKENRIWFIHCQFDGHSLPCECVLDRIIEYVFHMYEMVIHSWQLRYGPFIAFFESIIHLWIMLTDINL